MATRKDLANSFEDFIETWAVGLPLQIESEVGWNALGTLERYWPGLISNTLAEGFRGNTYAASLVDAGLVLESTHKIQGFRSLLNRLQSGEISAFRELTVAALFERAGVPIELEPPLNQRKLDIGFIYGNETVFAEVVTPNTSEFQKRLSDAMTGLAWYLYTRGRRNAIDIVLLDEPDPDLLGNMVAIDEEVDKNPLYDVLYSFENRIEWVYSKPTRPTTSVPSKPNKIQKTNLAQMLANPTNGAHIEVGFALDEPKRLGRLVDQEIKHFSRETTNLLILDTKNNPLNAKDKNQVINRRLQPNINRRLSGVLLLSEFYPLPTPGIRLVREWELISNPYAYKPLSSSLAKFLSGMNKYQLW